ncbi:hypothetical protein MMC10_009928 [Thelotrema lepadinum]|nr:hypothetical protein [Thelotrema lepadinum]
MRISSRQGLYNQQAPSRRQGSKISPDSITSSISRPRAFKAPSTARSALPHPRPNVAIPRAKVHTRKHKPALRPARLNKAQPTSSGISKPAKKPRPRRRPAKPGATDAKSEKLLSSLSSLAAALPASQLDEPGEDSNGDGATGEGTTKTIEVNGNKVRVSRPASGLKSRPGAMKRKAKVERAEKERFGMNLAVLAGLGNGEGLEGMEGVTSQGDPAVASTVDGEQGQAVHSSEKWKTLRNFIRLTS